MLLIVVSFHHDRYHESESGHHRCHSLQFVSFAAAALTNASDLSAMLSLRQCFKNFTGSNWYSSDDPCAGTSKLLGARS
jgi:hypothetical protein